MPAKMPNQNVTIVKLSPMAVPSRSSYHLDKLGIGEAAQIPLADLPMSGVSAIRNSITQAKKTWARGKRFTVRTDPINRMVLVYRQEDDCGE